jgi:hypothetical protein
VDAPADTLLSDLTAACPADAVAWLQAQCQRIAAGDERALFLALGQAGRKTGRAPLTRGRSADQAARTLLVLALPSQDATRWLATLDRCFHAGTVEELVALYQALPLMPHPQLLAARAAEGIRSSIAPVFAAVALDNPYPAAHLGEAAWNQMVLKAFFTAVDVDRIIGLRNRLNPDLGRMLAGYARERRAASRTLDPRLPPLARACGADCPDTP